MAIPLRTRVFSKLCCPHSNTRRYRSWLPSGYRRHGHGARSRSAFQGPGWSSAVHDPGAVAERGPLTLRHCPDTNGAARPDLSPHPAGERARCRSSSQLPRRRLGRGGSPPVGVVVQLRRSAEPGSSSSRSTTGSLRSTRSQSHRRTALRRNRLGRPSTAGGLGLWARPSRGDG